MSKIQREDNMFTQDARLEARVANLELYRRLTGSGGGGAGTVINLDTWHLVGATGEPAFQSGWSNVSSQGHPLAFRKDPFGKVMLRGVVSGGAVDSVIFTLPAGYRPASTAGTYERFVG